MKALPSCFTRKRIVAVGAIAAMAVVAWDLRHLYDAAKLWAPGVSVMSANVDLVSRDLPVLSLCKLGSDGPSGSFSTCIQKALPDLHSTVGMYGGVMLTNFWLNRHPDDAAVRAAALTTMDRLWDRYRRVDLAYYRMVDETADDMNKSVIYRAVAGVSDDGLELSWRDRLKAVEVSLHDPDLAKAQAARDVTFAVQTMTATHPAQGQSSVK